MKNIFNTEENLNLFNKNGIKVYEYFKNSDGLTRAFDKFYLFWCVGFIKRAVEYYWQDWNQEHLDNENDLKLTQQILKK